MACDKLVAFAIVAIILPTVAMATDFVVGDDNGWKVGVNYTQWADGKVFRVGDRLVFKYQAPHNVYKVDGAAFKICNASGTLLNSGNDVVELSLPGKKWYLCGFADHCAKGQKLVINVEGAGGPTPTPPPTTPQSTPTPTPAPAPAPNHSYRIFSSSYQIVFLAAVIMAIV